MFLFPAHPIGPVFPIAAAGRRWNGLGAGGQSRREHTRTRSQTPTREVQHRKRETQVVEIITKYAESCDVTGEIRYGST